MSLESEQAVKIRFEVQAVIFDEKMGRILALKMDTRRKLGLPKGGIEGDEPELHAITREVMEETGLELAGHRLEKVMDYGYPDSHGTGGVHLVHVYLVKMSLFDQEPTVGVKDSGGRIIGAFWLKVRDLLPRLHLDGEKVALSKLFLPETPPPVPVVSASFS
jgi:8-oxo-dGTP pyrophosphatase MutT (NUDIX family)